MVAFLLSSLALFSTLTVVSTSPALSERSTDTALAGPPGFNITSLGVNGSGCPPGSTYYKISDDKTAVTVTFSSYYAEAGPGISPADNRKNCQLTVGVAVPSGFTFGIANVDYRGYYQLDKSVTANQKAIYYFQGKVQQSTAQSGLVGAIDGKYYTYRDTFDLASTNLAPCGVNSVLNINSDIRVSNANNKAGSGYIATDSIDTSLSTTFNFQWQTCK
ncbi:secreted protein [Crepidotus variabilis]|uniref:Secreted protein n=1 Tax=Crepidotus variabilis TaxID=179855 RepID=A0A9P6JSY3_9AGAR|nr:secreted protein [Crepidotus variabilis]